MTVMPDVRQNVPKSIVARVSRNWLSFRGRLIRVWRAGVIPDAWRPLRIIAATAVAVFLLSLVLGATVDAAAIAFAEGQSGRSLRLFRIITRFGKSDWVLWSTLIVFVVILCGDWTRVGKRIALAWREIATLSVFLFLAIAVSGIIVNIIKQFVGRARPQTLEGAFAFDPFPYQYLYQSFPSGHSQVAGVLGVMAILVAPRLGWLAVAGCLVIAASRVMVSAHYPGDVIAGLVIGGGFTWLYAAALARAGLGFDIEPNGRVVARTTAILRAGPSALVGGLWAALSGRSQPAQIPRQGPR